MTLVLLIKHIRHFTLITVSFVTVNILDLPIKLNWDLLHRCNCKYHVEQSCSSLVYGSFWCSSSSSYSHIMLKSVNIPSCIISSVCVTAQIFSRLTVLDNVLHLLPDSEGQVAQVSWHMNQSSRRRLWIRLWDLDSGRTFRIRTAVTLPSEAERPETPADHSPFHRDWKLLQNKHTIYHQELNQSSINQSMDDLKSDL